MSSTDCSAQSTDAILSPEGRNDLCRMKKNPLPYVWFQSEQYAASTFFKVKLFTHYLSCTYCVSDNVTFDENTSFSGTGWNLLHIITGTWQRASLCVPCCLVEEDLCCLPPSAAAQLLSAWLHLLVTHRTLNMVCHFWLTACELDKTT